MAWLATRRRVLLCSWALVLAACSGGTSVSGAPPATAPLVASSDRSTAEPPSAAAPVNIGALPPGASEGDRTWAKRAAKDWFNAVFDAWDALPHYDPRPILELALPDSKQAQEVAWTLEAASYEGRKTVPATKRETRVLSTRFVDAKRVVIRICGASNVHFWVPDEDPLRAAVLLGSVLDLTLHRRGEDWLLASAREVTSLPKGASCASQ